MKLQDAAAASLVTEEMDQIATTVAARWPSQAELLPGVLSVASLVASIYWQQIQDQTLVHYALPLVQNEPLAAMHPPPL